jgi:hypothetical protein
MLHACVQIFDVMGNLEKFCKILGTKQAHGQMVLIVSSNRKHIMQFKDSILRHTY